MVAATRPVQTSLFPDVQPDKPLGPIVGSVHTGSNADLITAIAPLYLTGSVCDVTYGLGGWWNKYRPCRLVGHDGEPTKARDVCSDFRRLPHPDACFDAVCFDPPYVYSGTQATTPETERFRGAYGLVETSPRKVWATVEAGFTECVRVLKPGGWLLAKCMDFAQGGGGLEANDFRLQHVKLINFAATLDVDVWDLIVHHTGTGPGGTNIFTPKRARRHHSYLVVFQK